MITPSDLYHVFTAVVPLYVAMGLAYASVKWWKIFTVEQCSGINRFVALFAVPLLSFHFIAMNNPYSMSYSFIAADSLQKILILLALFIWSKSSSSSSSSLDSSITFFSISTLPNTLVMGIPLLRGMYGAPSSSLMVQIVVLQSILWYTLLLFLFEFRAATLLISHHFPNSASSIVSFSVHSDILSLHGSDPLDAHAEEVGSHGKLHVTVRKSTSSRSDVFSRRSNGHISILSLTPRPSNLTNAEIYSLQSSRNPTPRGSSFNHSDLYTMVNARMATAATAAATPRNSNFGNHGLEEEVGCSSSGSIPFRKGRKMTADGVFVWNVNSSPVSEGGIHVFRGADPTQQQQQLHKDVEDGEEFSFQRKEGEGEGEGGGGEKEGNKSGTKNNNNNTMPATSVMTRLILIMVWRKLVRNPNTYSSIIGLTWSLLSFRFGITMPAIVSRSISILSDAGLGMAMFSLGLFMALQPRIIACGCRVATFSMGVRFLVGPAVMAATSAAIGLRGVLLQIAIVQAGLPQGIVPFVFAKEYNVHPDILSTGVIFGMLIALPITLLYYILLGL